MLCRHGAHSLKVGANMSGQKDNRHGEKNARTGAQVVALVLAIVFLVQAACGICLICHGVVEWMGTTTYYYSAIKPIGTSFDISIGTIALTGVVPGILLLLLFARITRVRVRANGVGVAFTWLVFLVFSVVTGAWQGGAHLAFLVLAIAPVLYTACAVACARSRRSGSNAGHGSAS
jgi:hypothetical protein